MYTLQYQLFLFAFGLPEDKNAPQLRRCFDAAAASEVDVRSVLPRWSQKMSYGAVFLFFSILITYGNAFLTGAITNLCTDKSFFSYKKATTSWGFIRESSEKALDDSPWWELDPPYFKCTGCGKCCINDGEVWFDSDEFVDLARELQMSNEACLNEYAETVRSGWVKIRNARSSQSESVLQSSEEKVPPTELDQCALLNPDGKTCSVYKVRPMQCRTYPYWPRLLKSPQDWATEAALAPGQDQGSSDSKGGAFTTPILDGVSRLWSYEDGGCEGMTTHEADPADVLAIFRNREIYEFYMDRFPYAGMGSDVARFLARADLVRGVVETTAKWVREFVVRYHLCPFAEPVLLANAVRYRVFLGRGRASSMNAEGSELLKLGEEEAEEEEEGGVKRAALIEMLRQEVLYLLATPEEECATTLVMLPLDLQDFGAFHAFTTELENDILPVLEASCRLPSRSVGKDGAGLKEEEEEEAERQQQHLPEIQLACFHPEFRWDRLSDEDPLHFERRAVFPTINLLRGEKIRDWADETATRQIAVNNEAILRAQGAKALASQFASILATMLPP